MENSWPVWVGYGMKSNLQCKLWFKKSLDLHMSSSVGKFNKTSAFLVLWFFGLNNGKTRLLF